MAEQERIGEINGKYASSFKLLMATWKWIVTALTALATTGTLMVWDMRDDVVANRAAIEAVDERVNTAKMMGHYLRDQLSLLQDSQMMHVKDGHPGRVMDVNDRQDEELKELREQLK